MRTPGALAASSPGAQPVGNSLPVRHRGAAVPPASAPVIVTPARTQSAAAPGRPTSRPSVGAAIAARILRIASAGAARGLRPRTPASGACFPCRALHAASGVRRAQVAPAGQARLLVRHSSARRCRTERRRITPCAFASAACGVTAPAPSPLPMMLHTPPFRSHREYPGEGESERAGHAASSVIWAKGKGRELEVRGPLAAP